MDIFSTLKFRDFEIKNRFVMAPMCTYFADEDAKPNEFHTIHYAARSLGGVGMIIVEAAAVCPEGRITTKDIGLYNDDCLGHKNLVVNCKKFGAKIGIQLSHAGRKGRACKLLVSSSPTRFSNDFPTARELSVDEIKQIIKSFIQAATRAIDLGYDFVEIHAAHGYLINQFLSPLTNLRSDEFGGNFDKRVKILLDIMNGLNKQSIPFGVRISATEWETGGIDIDCSKKIAKIIQDCGSQFIHVSAGGNHLLPSQQPSIVPFYQCEYAKQIKDTVDIPVIAVGKIDSPAAAAALVLGGVCDCVAIGKELLKNPNFVQYGLKQFGRESEMFQPYKIAF